MTRALKVSIWVESVFLITDFVWYLIGCKLETAD